MVWQDEKRKQAMYQRRAAALQAMVDEINPRAYEGKLITGCRCWSALLKAISQILPHDTP